MKERNLDLINSCLYGLSIGDALGVPVEFKPRIYLKQNSVTDFIGNGSHNQPPGTWSDDSSLSFCLAESLTKGFNLKDIANSFLKWYESGYMTPHGKAFGIGKTTSYALNRIKSGTDPLEAGGKNVKDNGNGSLMRILPLLFYLDSNSFREDEKFEIIKKVSSITHGHSISIISCYIYIDFALYILDEYSLMEAYEKIQKEKEKYIEHLSKSESTIFNRILSENIKNISEDKIKSDGYVVDTLEASLWCLLSTKSYSEAVLKAVNLGLDTDTTATVTGGIAGLYYGLSNIPEKWISGIVESDFIFGLGNKLYTTYYKKGLF
ncbi:MAG: ADP-ribosylglycohydrolase family protein [Leptospiraceae bacterium]|nr:ADP-ribosylglycohydrolase family protein [Leptospiraceae bacterium]MCP5494087.1 ADP-ribosylglycohydrolase family protein [Leptospiraceae bacterium]